MIQEKWVIYTANDTEFVFDIHQVSCIESQLHKEGQPYRTIYYRNNKPVNYSVDQGYKIMSPMEEAAIIESIQPSEQRQCANCGEPLHGNNTYFRAGNNGSTYCNKDCAYEAYNGFYSKKQVDQTLVKIEKR
ncbi:hypothetical protein [Sediminibacillus terrae]|uniref:hypothetical protein n=1 Tax=Sediminibacillus terrae TaxID=1562106 RepID=UPI001296F6CC|nr:hypothetical protein [Sediminibacillus terrae]